MADRTGQQFGNYRLLRILGEGGFAEVYLGEHIHLNSQAAIKILDTKLTSENAEHFRTEARTLIHLEHPHIIRTLEYGIEDGIPFLVMSYAPNGNLRQRHPQGTRLPLETVISHVKQIADALQYAHNEKLIHRDIKPENMLVGRNNEIILSDFGIALLVQSTNKQSKKEVVGTVSYMAPEQIRGRPRFASDQYALAAVAYEWLCGEEPFTGSFTEVALQHLLIAPDPLTERVPVVPSAVEQVIMKALAKDPNERFTQVQEFAQALERASSSLSSFRAQSSTASEFESPLKEPVSLPLAYAPGYTATFLPPQKRSLSEEYTPGLLPASRQEFTYAVPDSLPRSKSNREERTGRRFSRRTVLAGLTGLGIGLGVGAGALWLAYSQGAQSSAQQLIHQVFPVTRSLLTYTGHIQAVNSIAWSPDGNRLASGSSDKTVQVFDASSGRLLTKYTGHSDKVYGVAWSPDSTRIVSACQDGTLHVWDASTGTRIHAFPADNGSTYNSTAPMYGVWWSTEVDRILFAGEETVGTILASSWQFVGGGFQGQVGATNAAGWAPHSPVFAEALADHTVVAWDIYTEIGMATCTGHTRKVLALAWSPDGTKLVTGSQDRTVKIWDIPDVTQVMSAQGTNILSYTGHTDWVLAVDWSPDGSKIASAGRDKTVQIWDAKTGKLLFTYRGHTAPVNAVSWSLDGHSLVSASDDKTVQIWKPS